ncbi:MAG: DUF86 domain-containing protein [Armatimonadota bacterium]
MKDDRLYLIHISECISRIEDYVSGGRDEFLGSPLIQDAVIRNLQTMAESTQRLSDRLKLRYTEIDWRRISGFRNVIVHDYLGIDIPYVWQIIEKELPSLKHTIKTMLDEN